nr:CMF_HP1_G0006500.mRNA.1.CDS.1 [Saccharomyces cerevisiae]
MVLSNLSNQNDWKLETERLISQSQLEKFKNIIASPTQAQDLIMWFSLDFHWGRDEGFYHLCFYAVVQKTTQILVSDFINAKQLWHLGYVKSLHKQISAEDLTIAAKTHILRISFLDRKRAKEFIDDFADPYTVFQHFS